MSQRLSNHEWQRRCGDSLSRSLVRRQTRSRFFGYWAATWLVMAAIAGLIAGALGFALYLAVR